MRMLHVIATPRGETSHTLRVSNAYLDAMRGRHPGLEIDELNLYEFDLPAVAGNNIRAKYMLLAGSPVDEDARESWAHIEQTITHFLRADRYLITAPMWNFSVPYVLKYYIDCIVQPGYLYRYDETGQVVPLVNGRSMVCVTSRGADYKPGSALQAFDFQEPYLRTIFGFIGIRDITFINAEPMDYHPALRASAITAAIAEAVAIANAPAA
jgi:FMN-dependent NADH-azoreductase